MDFQGYQNLFEKILKGDEVAKPYDDPQLREFVRLNSSRMNRWLKTASINEKLKSRIQSIPNPQRWIVITEPWCGDASHSVPFFHLLSQLNPLIRVDYELRDSPPHRIQDYLTNGSKAIPVLIVKDAGENDLFTWSSRPAEAEQLRERLRKENTHPDTIKTHLQQWYNMDKGRSLQEELLALFDRSSK